MIKVTVTQRVGFISVFCGLLAIGCSDDGSTEQGVTAGTGEQSGNGGSTPSGAAGMVTTPAAGSGTTPAPTGSAGQSSSAAGTGSITPPTSAAGTPAAGSGVAGASGMTASGGTAGASGMTAPATDEKFSFFVASWAAMQRLSKSPNGFGGDLRYGEADGLSGADKICTEIAETSMPGSGAKGWRAFLSAVKGPNGQPVHAIDRIGEGPWYDRLGRLVSMNKTSILMSRPGGADAMIINDLPNEDGVPNHAPDGMLVDNHDILTGTNNKGQVFSMDARFTCQDWTSSKGADGTPRVGHSWPRMGGGFGGGGRPGRGGAAGSGTGFVPPGGLGGSGAFPGGGEFDLANWMSSLNEAGCGAGASLVEMGPPNPANPTVGSGGGYGGIYCFALKP